MVLCLNLIQFSLFTEFLHGWLPTSFRFQFSASLKKKEKKNKYGTKQYIIPPGANEREEVTCTWDLEIITLKVVRFNSFSMLM